MLCTARLESRRSTGPSLSYDAPAVAEILLAGGVTIDVATRDDLEAHHRRLAAYLERPHARYVRPHNGGPPRAANLPFAIGLGRPPMGMMWLIQWVLLMGDDPTSATAIANVRAAVIVGARPTDASMSGGAALVGLDYANVVINGLAVPTPGPVTVPDKNVVHSQEELYAVIGGTGTVAGAANYRFTAGCLELPERADSLMW